MIDKTHWHAFPTYSQNLYNGRRIKSGFGRINFPNKYQKCYHKTVLRVYTENSFNSPSLGNTSSGGVLMEREGWSNNAFFPDGEYKTVKLVVTRLYVAVAKGTRPILIYSTEEDCVEFNFADGYGISLHGRSLFEVLGFKGVLDPNRGGYFIGNMTKWWRNQGCIRQML